MAMVRSAVTKAQIAGRQSAMRELLDMALILETEAKNRNAAAARGGTLYSSPNDVSALNTRKGLLEAAAVLKKAAVASEKQIELLLHAPCPACSRMQSKHCAGCGGCPDMTIVPGGTGHLTSDCPSLVESRTKKEPVPA